MANSQSSMLLFDFPHVPEHITDGNFEWLKCRCGWSCLPQRSSSTWSWTYEHIELWERYRIHCEDALGTIYPSKLWDSLLEEVKKVGLNEERHRILIENVELEDVIEDLRLVTKRLTAFAKTRERSVGEE